MRIAEKFNELRRRDEGALIAYVCAGDGDTPEIVRALVRAGADIIELGLPFSDPVADGPTIQASIQRALDSGMNPDKYFRMVKELDVTIPLIVMTYYNLIFKRGLKKFVKDCQDSGINGIIVPDLPLEESEELAAHCIDNDIDLIFLIAPTTIGDRLQKIITKGTGFLYLVSRLGVTGAKADVAVSTKILLDRVKTDTPKAVGFGISSGRQAKEIIQMGADGVIVGSALVDIIASNNNVTQRLELLAREIKSGLKE
jgi:tryptophan synthase alpha chain